MGAGAGRTARRWDLLVAVVLVACFAVLGNRARDEFHWSAWAFGDAQTMLSSRQWTEGGWIANRLLFAPQGHVPGIEILDDPPLRHHAHGTWSGGEDRVGPRRLYTHYPSGYLAPYAALYGLGATGPFPARLLSLALSVGAAGLFYAALVRVLVRPAAVAAVLVYVAAAVFRAYADSLANHPVDDFLRFAFVLLSMRASDPGRARTWGALAWIVQFALALVSLDSVFFVMAWLVGWDLVSGRGPRWRVWTLHALAPAAAGALLFAQNAWYLGAGDAWTDARDVLLLKIGATFGQEGSRFDVLRWMADGLAGWAWIGVLALLWVRAFTRDRERPPDVVRAHGLLLVLLVSGLTFPLVLEVAGGMPYQGRQILPWAAATAGTLFAASLASAGSCRTPAGRFAARAGAFAFLVANLALFGAGRIERVGIAGDPSEIRATPDVALAREAVATLRTDHPPIVFSYWGFVHFWNPTYEEGYPQIDPLLEFYAGSRPILCFTHGDALARDLAYLIEGAPQPFSPVLVASEEGPYEEAISILLESGVVTHRPDPVTRHSGRVVADLTDVVVPEGAARHEP